MPPPHSLREAVEARLPRFLAELEALVNIDCGSYTPAGVNRVADLVAAVAGGAWRARSSASPTQPAAGERQLGDLVIGAPARRRAAAAC